MAQVVLGRAGEAEEAEAEADTDDIVLKRVLYNEGNH
jgi:hypothetical protein